VVIVLILIIVGVSYYFREDARYKRLTIITVDDITINMDYFLMRTRLADADAMVMLERLTNEQLIKIEAPRYVAEVTPEDIDETLRRVARGESETISESEFKGWYRQLLNEIGLSDSEYKEIVATSLLTARLHAYLAERVPTVAEQVHLHSALLSTEEVAEIWEKGDAGENTEELISEIWQDKQSEGTVEDLGWLPRGVLPPGFDQVAFNLTIDDVSEPLVYVSDPTSTEPETFYYLLMVSEKAEAREIDENHLQILKAQALDDWLVEEIKFHEIGWHGLKNGFDSETYAWISWQLAKE
jgi:parvulin-like peptidyl-prolyl isomerase